MPTELFGSGTIPQTGDTERMLMVKEVISTNNGGGGGAPTSINYPGPPVTNPPLLANIVVDSNRRTWTYVAGQGWA